MDWIPASDVHERLRTRNLSYCMQMSRNLEIVHCSYCLLCDKNTNVRQLHPCFVMQYSWGWDPRTSCTFVLNTKTKHKTVLVTRGLLFSLHCAVLRNQWIKCKEVRKRLEVHEALWKFICNQSFHYSQFEEKRTIWS